MAVNFILFSTFNASSTYFSAHFCRSFSDSFRFASAFFYVLFLFRWCCLCTQEKMLLYCCCLMSMLICELLWSDGCSVQVQKYSYTGLRNGMSLVHFMHGHWIKLCAVMSHNAKQLLIAHCWNLNRFIHVAFSNAIYPLESTRVSEKRFQVSRRKWQY